MLQGKVAIVTGSTSGIGLGIADGLAAEGVDIVLNGFGDAGDVKRAQTDLALHIRLVGPAPPDDEFGPEELTLVDLDESGRPVAGAKTPKPRQAPA